MIRDREETTEVVERKKKFMHQSESNIVQTWNGTDSECEDPSEDDWDDNFISAATSLDYFNNSNEIESLNSNLGNTCAEAREIFVENVVCRR